MLCQIRAVTVSAYLLLIVCAYLLGSIPSGYLAGRFKGIDIRTLGSGNIGATNVFRNLGKTAGILVLLSDALKGWLACRPLVAVIANAFHLPSTELEKATLVAGVVAILGHNYTCWLQFKGGKGVATTAGVLLGWSPVGFSIALVSWVATFAISKYVSLASIVAAVVLPFAVWYSGGSRVMIVINACLGALAIYKHKPNIQRLLNGTEHRFGKKKTEAAEA